jgi:hypothetical protein
MTDSLEGNRKTERLRAALRENLKRRKAQARERSAAETAASPKPSTFTPSTFKPSPFAPSTSPHGSAGIGVDKQKR